MRRRLEALRPLPCLRHTLRSAAVALCLAALLPAHAGEAAPAADDPALEARMLAVAAELRCLVCQNQTIADSHSGLAEDLRRELRVQLKRGASDDEVRRYMTERYGDFVLYRPPLKPATWLLWAGPGLLLAGALGTLALTLRRRARLDPGRFDTEMDDEPEAAR
ncbi:cytochrome c-type biogenesis protein [Aquabacterium humicola]|uniref:cytochrome c-type biogenesis protein n=1 Tax=Aquabacterium humicola TaxID=3237377 RepID=UPI002543CACA|nr:cytochrome c-type biogenesis protein [Rubrivivax pictus]